MGYFVGIDLGGSKIAAVVIDETGHISGRYQLPTEARLGLNHVVERMIFAAQEAINLAGLTQCDIWGVGVGSPGPVNPATGEVNNPPNLPGWGLVPLQGILQEHFGPPVVVGNDANAAALAENRWGAGQGCSEMVYLTISTGVGAGIISGGKLLRGAKGSAGEVGHMILDPQGPACGCGARGCLEAFCSGTAVAWEAERLLQCGFTSVLGDRSSGTKIRAEHVIAACQEGDALAQVVVDRLMQYLSIGVANLVNILNPQKVIIGGGVAKAGELIFVPLHQKMQKLALPSCRDTEIVPALLGDQAGPLGAALLAIDNQ